jgi:Uma2 family endonuclease
MAKQAVSNEPIHYPDSDGKPMADNTRQFDWIVTIKENLDAVLPCFVGGDLLWYPFEGDNKTRIAPDVLVALGRPKGPRGSYRTWEEGNVVPQVVFEVLSPGNTTTEMNRKSRQYADYGVQEYYEYDPDHNRLRGWVRQGTEVVDINPNRWVSPLLKIRFEPGEPELVIRHANGEIFETWAQHAARIAEERHQAEMEAQRAEAADQRAEAADQRAEAADQRAEAADQRAEAADQRAEVESQRAETEAQRAEAQFQRAERLLARLKALGLDE